MPVTRSLSNIDSVNVSPILPGRNVRARKQTTEPQSIGGGGGGGGEEEEEKEACPSILMSFTTSSTSNLDPRTRHSATPSTIDNDEWLNHLQIFSHRGELIINEKGKKQVDRIIDKDGEKQIVTGYDKGWQNKKRDTNFTSTAIACILGERSGVCVLDFDDKSLYNELLVITGKNGKVSNDFRDRCWPTVKTQRGYHVYFEYSGETRDAIDSLPQAIGKLDLKRNGQIWFPGCRVRQRDGSYFRYEWMLHDKLMGTGVGLLCQMPCDLIDKLTQMATSRREGSATSIPVQCASLQMAPTIDTTTMPSQVVLSGSLNSSDLNSDQKRAALITGQHVMEYKVWFQIMCAIKNTQCTYEDAVALTNRYLVASGKSETSRFEKLRKMWDNVDSKSTLGTIIHHAQICNRAALTKLCRDEKSAEKTTSRGSKTNLGQGQAQGVGNQNDEWDAYKQLEENEDEWSDFNCADIYLGQQGEELIYQHSVLYVYDSECVRWRIDDDGHAVQNDINIYLTQVAEHWQHQWEGLLKRVDGDDGGGGGDVEDEANSVLVKQIKKKISSWKNNIFIINSVTKTKNVYKAIRSRLALRGDAIEFDEQRDLFAWDNVVFDVRTGEVVSPKKEDYILTTNGQKWHEPSGEEMRTIAKMFEDIFPNEKHRQSYESVLWTGLTGHRKEKFIIAQGEGRNGKGALNEFMLDLLGDYGSTIHLGLLTKPIKLGPNDALRRLHKKRFALASEPDDASSEQLKSNNIKALTGNEKHNAAAKYSNDSDTRIHMTTVMECNDLPFIQGGTGEAMVARIIIVPFLVTFTNDTIKLASRPTKYKPLKEIYKKHDFKRQHAPALFKYLCSQGYNDLIITDESQQLGFKYLCTKDELTAWFDTYYERDDRDMVSVKELFAKLKRTTFYTEMDKKEKRLYTYNSFVTNILKSLALSKYMLEPDQYHLGKRVKAYTMRGWKERPGMMDDDDDRRGRW